MSVVEQAVELAEMGLAVFPCSSSKRPLTKHGHNDATNDPLKAEELFKFYGEAATQIGVRMGGASGLFCIDADTYKSQEVDDFIKDLKDKGLLPKTRVHKTLHGGLHIFYKSSHGYPTLSPSDDLDIKGEGSYVIWWPATIPDSVVSEGLTEAPPALLEHLKSLRRAASTETIEGLKAKILEAKNFHDSLARLASRYAAMGWEASDIRNAIIKALNASIAADPNHARHDRWKKLIDDSEQEVSRIIYTAYDKYSSAGASESLADAMLDKKEKIDAIAGILNFKKPDSPMGETETIIPLEAYDINIWPFEGEGYFAHENHDLMKQRFIMHPMFCEDETVLIAAEPKTGKTAISLTAGLHVACGIDLGPGLKVAEPRSVLYFGLEGKRAIKLRIAAWRKWMEEKGEKLPADIPFFVVENSKNFLVEADRINVCNQIAAADAYTKNRSERGLGLGLIFIDTYTKAMPGGDQNSVEDTSAVFEMVGRLRNLGVTAAIIFVHHKARAGNIRGSSNIEADPDVISSIEKEGNEVRWVINRARSVEEGGAYRFIFHNYDLGISEQGYAINAPVVEAIDALSADKVVSLDEAKDMSRAASMIIAMGRGNHSLKDVLKLLHSVNLAPVIKSRRVKSLAAWDSDEAQKFIRHLVPETGLIHADGNVKAQLDARGKIVSLDVF